MANEKVSIIIPSYNHGKYLRKTLDSVLQQTYQNFELIIVDDCSTDNSQEIIKSYKDKRIRKYFNSTNQGAVDTLNQLIDLANGEYIAILNSDDYWSKDKIEKQVKYLDSNPNIGACFTWADFIDESGKNIYDDEITATDLFQKKNKKQNEWFRFLFENGNCLCHPSVMIRKKIYDEIGKYQSIYRQLPDFEFWIRLIKKYDIHILEENLTHFRILTKDGKNSSYLTKENKNLMEYEMFMIKEIFFEECDNKLFYEAFKDALINRNCIKDERMLEYEKNMLLYNSRYYKQIGRFVGYKKMGKLFLDTKKRDFLEEVYHFNLKNYYVLGEKITNLDIVYFEHQFIEKIPDHIINSRFYRWSNKIYNTKFYALSLKVRLGLRKLIGK